MRVQDGRAIGLRRAEEQRRDLETVAAAVGKLLGFAQLQRCQRRRVGERKLRASAALRVDAVQVWRQQVRFIFHGNEGAGRRPSRAPVHAAPGAQIFYGSAAGVHQHQVQRAIAVECGGQLPAVRAPGKLRKVRAGMRQLLQSAAIGCNTPNLRIASALREECNAPSVRRPARLRIFLVRRIRDQVRCAALQVDQLQRQAVQVCARRVHAHKLAPVGRGLRVGVVAGSLREAARHRTEPVGQHQLR